MEKNNGTRILAVLALVVAVAGLSLGFAAFSTTLKVSTAARVTATTGNWNVGFSTDGTTIEDASTARTKTAVGAPTQPGVIDVKKYVITQNTNATLSTTTGSSVSYELSILNKGNMVAYLDAVNFDNVTVTCTNVTGTDATPIDVVDGAGTSVIGGNTTTISDTDCAKMFNVTLNIGGTNYTSTTTGITGSSIAATTGSAPVTLTVAYADTADAQAVAATLDGDIIVNIGAISVVYTSTAPSAGGGA